LTRRYFADKVDVVCSSTIYACHSSLSNEKSIFPHAFLYPSLPANMSWETSTTGPATEGGETWGSAVAATTDAPTADGGDTWGAGGDGAEAAGTSEEPPKPQLSKEEMLAKATEAGWTERTAFDYEKYLRNGDQKIDWFGAAKVYEWKDEYGDVAPEVPELEKILFGGEFLMRKGDRIEAIQTIKVNIEGPKDIQPVRRVRNTFLFDWPRLT
jgi:hypothetical protein